jgi:hypothetical protein
MLRGALSAFQRWNYRGGRPSWTARASNRLSAIAFAAGLGPRHAATLEVLGRTTGRTISFPVVVADHQGGRYLVAMLGQKTKWVRNLRADGHAVLLMRRKRETSHWSKTSPMTGLRSCVATSSLLRAHARSFRSTAVRRWVSSSGL